MKKPVSQILFASIVILLCVVFYLQTSNLPDAASRLPKVLIAVILLLSVIMILKFLFLCKKTNASDFSIAGTSGTSDRSARSDPVEPVSIHHRETDHSPMTTESARSGGRTGHDPKAQHDPDFHLKRILVFIGLTAGYIATLEWLGYFIVTPVYLLASHSYLKATTPLKMILIASVFTVFIYLLFVLFLHLPVPMGILS